MHRIPPEHTTIQVRGLTDEMYRALALPSLQYRSLTKIAATFLSNHHHELMDVILQRRVFQETKQGYGDWNERWRNFQGMLSHEINQLHIPNCLNEDIHEQVMRLLCSVLSFEYPQILNPAIRFTPRGNLDVSRMLEDYVTARSFHDLPRKERYDLLYVACSLYQSRCIQLILCDLLLWRRSRLEPLLRNAVRLIEMNSHENLGRYGYMSFHLEYAGDPAPWTSFVVTLNNQLRSRQESYEDIVFYFQQNMVIVSLSAGIKSEWMFLWPKLTTFQKATHAKWFSECALLASDAYLLIDVMRYLDSPTRTRFLNKDPVGFIFCFLKHPHDRRFVPDLQMQELRMIRHHDMFTVQVLKTHIHHIYLEGTFCRSHRDTFVQLRRYFCSRNFLFGLSKVRDKIDWVLGIVLNVNPWLISDPGTDAHKAIAGFYYEFLRKYTFD